MNLYGVEVELENIPRTAYERTMHFWEVVGDGSLRNRGAEFRNRMPVSFEDMPEALHELHETIQRFRSAPDPSSRCGIHIHMDARDLGAEQVNSLLLNYIWIEEALFNQWPLRKQGNFCVPYSALRSHIPGILHALRKGRLMEVSERARKYSAVNIAPYLHQGSIEWRQFPAVLPVMEAMQWVDMINAVKEVSKLRVMDRQEASAFCMSYFNYHNEDALDDSEELIYSVDLEDSRMFRPMFHDPVVMEESMEEVEDLHEFEPHPDFMPQENPNMTAEELNARIRNDIQRARERFGLPIEEAEGIASRPVNTPEL